MQEQKTIKLINELHDVNQELNKENESQEKIIKKLRDDREALLERIDELEYDLAFEIDKKVAKIKDLLYENMLLSEEVESLKRDKFDLLDRIEEYECVEPVELDINEDIPF